MLLASDSYVNKSIQDRGEREKRGREKGHREGKIKRERSRTEAKLEKN